MDDLLVGLDIGSSKIRCLLATREEEGPPKVVAWGMSSSDGVRSGVIINIRSASQVISQAVTEVENRGYEIERVTSAISGVSIDGINSRGVVAITKGREIGNTEIEKALEAARAVVIPEDRELLHVIPQEYIVDGTPDIMDPRGMMGVRLEVETHIVTVPLTAIRNLLSAVNSSGFKVEELLFSALAAGDASLTLDEKNYGCVHLHLGAGTTDVMLWYKGAPRFTRSYSLGGNLVTSDIANVLRVSLPEAEGLKLQEGSCYPGILDNDKIVIQRVGDSRFTEINRSELIEIITARVAETLQIIQSDLQRSGYLDRISGGVVLTGGAAQQLGMLELVQDLFGRHARVAVPMGLAGLRNPISGTEWSACCGLVLAASRTRTSLGQLSTKSKKGVGLWEWIQSILKKII